MIAPTFQRPRQCHPAHVHRIEIRPGQEREQGFARGDGVLPEREAFVRLPLLLEDPSQALEGLPSSVLRGDRAGVPRDDPVPVPQGLGVKRFSFDQPTLELEVPAEEQVHDGQHLPDREVVRSPPSELEDPGPRGIERRDESIPGDDHGRLDAPLPQVEDLGEGRAAHLVVGLGADAGPARRPARGGGRRGSWSRGSSPGWPPKRRPRGGGDTASIPSRRGRPVAQIGRPSSHRTRSSARAPADGWRGAGPSRGRPGRGPRGREDPEIEPARRHRFLRLDASDRLGDGIGQERGTAGEQLVEDHSHRVDVGGGTQGRTSAAELLGRHVQQRALTAPVPVVAASSLVRAIPKSASLSTAQVQGRPRRGVDQDVGRLEVEVRDTGEVELLQGTGDGHQQRRGVAGRQRAGQPFLQAAAREVLQHEVGPAAGLVHPVELDDVGDGAPRPREPPSASGSRSRGAAKGPIERNLTATCRSG